MNKKICVVGAGNWGENHIRTLDKMDSLGAVVEPSKSRLNQILNKYQGVQGYSSIDKAINEKFDGFIVATPAETHFKIAKKIIKSNFHVLIEKPMTLSVEDSEQLVILAKKKKVNLMVGHVLLFHPAIKKIKNMIENGNIGTLQYMYSNRLNLGKVRTEENVFWSLAPHDIAIFQYITNSYPIKINAQGSIILQNKIFDSTMTHFEYRNGVKAHIFVSWLHPFKEHRLVFIGSEAMISFEDSKEGKPLKLYSKKFDLNKGIPEKIDGPVTSISYESQPALHSELKYFIDHCAEKKIKISNGDHGLEVVRILVEVSKKLV